MKKYANRKDANHQEIIKAFRSLGWTVLDVSNLPNCFDILVAKNATTVCVEIKDGAKPPSQRKLTKGEQEFKESWPGHYEIIINTDEVLEANEFYS